MVEAIEETVLFVVVRRIVEKVESSDFDTLIGMKTVMLFDCV